MGKVIKKSRKSTKSVRSSSIVWLLVPALLILGCILYLSKGEKANLPPVQVAQEQEEAPVEEPEDSVVAEPVTKAEIKKQKKTDLINSDVFLKTILHSALKLGVLEDLFHVKVRDEGIFIDIPLNKAKTDFNYANYYIQSQLIKNNGVLISGKESKYADYQTLIFQDNLTKKNYTIKLHYDTKHSYPQEKTKLAIIVDDFGSFSGDLLDEFCELDRNLTFAIMPNQKYSKVSMQKASQKGHELILHIPMEPIDYPKSNPGKDAVFVQYKPAKIQSIVLDGFKQLPLCVGANNHMGSLASTDEGVMGAVMEVLKQRGSYFVDSRTTPASVAYKVAQKFLIPSYQRDLYLDDPNISDKNFQEKITRLEELKLKRNSVIVITHCHNEEKLVYLKKFIKKAEQMGFELVPVSLLEKSKI